MCHKMYVENGNECFSISDFLVFSSFFFFQPLLLIIFESTHSFNIGRVSKRKWKKKTYKRKVTYRTIEVSYIIKNDVMDLVYDWKYNKLDYHFSFFLYFFSSLIFSIISRLNLYYYTSLYKTDTIHLILAHSSQYWNSL